MLRVAVLVSIGRHPASGRARRAVRDAQAVELALGIPRAHVEVLHAGDPDEPALRDYLGMGIGAVRVLGLQPGSDPVPALVAWLRQGFPDLILAGTHAEAGEGSGLVPYLVAEALGVPLVPAIDHGEIDGSQVRLRQVRPRGQRRALSASLPLLATVDAAAPEARPFAYAPARRGRIEVVGTPAIADARAGLWNRAPAKARPKRLRAAITGSAEERIRAATQLVGGGGTAMLHPDPEAAAQAIWDFLVREGIVAAAHSGGTGHGAG